MTMHPELAGLLADARANPDDDGARLIIADWLEENDDFDGAARGRFIRAQVQLAGQSLPPRRRLELSAEVTLEGELHGRHWLGELTRVRGVADGEFVRGLLRLKISASIVEEGRLATLPELPNWAWVDGLICVGAGWRRAVEGLVIPRSSRGYGT